MTLADSLKQALALSDEDFATQIGDNRTNAEIANDRLAPLHAALCDAAAALELTAAIMRNEFHERTCLQSRGCYCSDSAADVAIARLKGLVEK